MGATRITIELQRQIDESYPLIIGRHVLPELLQVLAQPDLAQRRIAVISDSTVAENYCGEIMEALAAAGRPAQLFTFPAGEKSKTRATKERLEDEMLAAGYNRDTVVLAVGGGVVTDLAGFVAATFTRGVPYVSYTTTLVGAADAAIGGKTAVDTPAATNLIGAFHQPCGVVIDLETWLTLDAPKIRDGLGETVKHACIADAEFFARLEDAFVTRKLTPEQFVREAELAHYTALRNAEIKQDFVQSDVTEGNRRMALNLGHTIGRALEAALGFTWAHGECVAVGLNLQARLGRSFGYLTATEAERIENLLLAIGLPTEIPAGVSVDAIMAAMGHDKKSLGGQVRFVFQRGIGAMQTFENGSYARVIPVADIREFLEAQPKGK
ncbi:3-dehydroquinate synthase [Actinobaculum suis]|uniref:3-dehydroquinate synthase n=1 Tax=Actinobaculum suis TaxID=1657 RepID=UPI00066FE32D|nr:3-dehydroquinate synthase [Actinobaculum suis]